jgi:glutamate synthase domain-containing protein 3
VETYTDYGRIVEWIGRIRRIFKEALTEYEVLDDKAWELDAELSHLYYSLHSLYDLIKRALEEGKITKARELLKEAERKAEKFKKLIDRASEFNAKASDEWSAIKNRAINSILEYEHKMPEDLKGKVHETYINMLFELEPPLSVFGKYSDQYLSNAEWLISLMRRDIEVSEETAKRLST